MNENSSWCVGIDYWYRRENKLYRIYRWVAPAPSTNRRSGDRYGVRTSRGWNIWIGYDMENRRWAIL